MYKYVYFNEQGMFGLVKIGYQPDSFAKKLVLLIRIFLDGVLLISKNSWVECWNFPKFSISFEKCIFV